MGRPSKPSPDRRSRIERDRIIVALLDAGHPSANIALLSGLSARQVNHIRRAAGGEAAPPLLTPVELRELRREHATDPAALAWLARQRTDCRRPAGPS